MAESRALNLADPAATERLGHAVAQALAAQHPVQCCGYLDGELGAGKTALRVPSGRPGYQGECSPYTLVEPIPQVVPAPACRSVSPGDPAELDYLILPTGLRRLPAGQWPERGRATPADLRPAFQLKVWVVGRFER
jgi:hypothetical protein